MDKPSGPTSHDIVARARRHFKTRRIGHAGTLDPMATGVLVLLFGEATKLCDVASGSDKRYAAELRFGRSTDSHDADGATTEEAAIPPGFRISEEQLTRALSAERARERQLPPVVSALKVDGQRAHRLSRAGMPPELAPRPVRVHSLELGSWDQHRAHLELLVSKGYYVRALARDLSQALGVPAHLSQLRRLQSGGFSLAEACSWPPPDDCHPVALAAALPRLVPTLRLTPSGVTRARLGQALRSTDFIDLPAESSTETGRTSLWAWTDAAGTPVALGEYKADGYRVRRGFSADLVLGERDQTDAISVG